MSSLDGEALAEWVTLNPRQNDNMEPMWEDSRQRTVNTKTLRKESAYLLEEPESSWCG